MRNEWSKGFNLKTDWITKNKKALLSPIGLFIGTLGICCIPITQSLISYPIKAQPTETFTKKSFVAEALARSGPAVVTLETQRRVIQGNSALPPGLLMDPYLQRFFGLQGMRRPRSRIERGQGSGVIFSSDGFVLTNAHVVEKTDRLMIGMSDNRRVPGRVVGQDSLTDLAVIQLEGSGPWPSAPLGNSDQLTVGDWAIAVGNPFGLENTVTLGIISNLNRNVSQLGISGKRFELIQTDAAINPGNSGGPLLNAKGEVIGINTLVRSGPGAGLGFAIPINRARAIAKQLVEKGRASHPMIGVSLSSLPSNNSNDFNFNEAGAMIRYVMPGSPADIGGLQVGDVIISVGGKEINSPRDVITAINRHGEGSPLMFEIRRSIQTLNLAITPIDMNSISNF
ncbi:trypsin-like peptidase domain-containing protein [Prochlorococcus sp. MIT 1307]|uniref:trypsin-like peptidase domain-containing protein n=1 Tax=Prochlorococcus sp. MIT 1307 TaxID=3096219 RepID=UPI002A751522|nr:trypsin-like peptidase domain-containing protein [Prochlorococcus sp. MIT 1307]